jgi:hypothetical protein
MKNHVCFRRRAPQLEKLAPAVAAGAQEGRAGAGPPTSSYSRFLKGSPSTSTDVDKLADTPFDGDAAPANGRASRSSPSSAARACRSAAGCPRPGVARKRSASLLRQRGVDRLKLDALKVSHHASQNNLSKDIPRAHRLQALLHLDERRLLLPSRPRGDRPHHQVRRREPELTFNYLTRYNEVWKRPDLQERYRYSARYPTSGGRWGSAAAR